MSFEWEEIEYITEDSQNINIYEYDGNYPSELTLDVIDEATVNEILFEEVGEINYDDILGNLDDFIQIPKQKKAKVVKTIEIKKQKVKKEIARNFECNLCNAKLPSMAYLKRHYNTKGHQRKLIKKTGVQFIEIKDTTRVEQLTALTNDDIEMIHSFDDQIEQITGNSSFGTTIMTPDASLDGIDLNLNDFRAADAILTFNLTSNPENVVSIPIKSTKSDYFCQHCNKTFTQKCYFTQHNKAHHSGPKNFKCEKCGKKYATEIDLENHKLKHSDSKPFKCDRLKCNHSYNNKIDLKRHEKNHEEMENVCLICSKGFVRRDHLRKHYLVHERKGQKQLMKVMGNNY